VHECARMVRARLRSVLRAVCLHARLACALLYAAFGVLLSFVYWLP
jgi:hypothetical protein